MPLKFQKIYADDPKRPGRRIVVGTKKTQGGKVTYISKGPVEKKKPTMSNFLATLFKPAIDRKIAGAIAEGAKAVDGRLENDDTVTIPLKRTTPPTREEIKKYQALSDEARKKEEKKPSRFGDLGMPDLSKYKSYESLVDQGLMGSGTDIRQQIDKLFNPGNLTLKDSRFNRGR